MLAEFCDGDSVLPETFRFAWANGQPTTEATIIENEKEAFTSESDTGGLGRDSEEERKDGDETEVESSKEDEDDDTDYANEEDEAYKLEGYSECEEEDDAYSVRKVGFRASGDNPSDRMDDKAIASNEDLNADTILYTAVETNRLEELIFGLSISFITEEVTNGQPSSSVLVYYSGVLGFTDDGLTFRRVKDYTREFQSLRAFGRKLAETDPPAFTMRWSEDGQTAYYDDGYITMEAFRNFGHHILGKAEALCETLMYGWSPDLNLSEVKDDMRNTQLGYSFVQHPANGLSMAYLELCARCVGSRQVGSYIGKCGAIRPFANI
ncbi:hypothetical protein H2199_004320 [Coniosporium tulheliwenetii]|uniref:Uncharacterized protein n=1 Tax=Coniosporium tulheliwenetii TaxID=3383036 RepID=A0ACC2Z7L3_9PEZI|nr:hypothetical protein H2199_004320 [Cladosporium sp. JES 115]